MHRKSSVSETISLIFNVFIVFFGIIGTFLMMYGTKSNGALMVKGFRNFKYFTVLSNEFCVAVAILFILSVVFNRKFPVLIKLIATSSVALTFIIVAAFLAPIYPDLNMYQGGNFWFHLVVPVIATVEFLILPHKQKIPFSYAVISALPALFYGLFYFINIVINGKGEWPQTNDWYGFLNWGYKVGFVIFASVIIMNLGCATFLRSLYNRGAAKNNA